MRPSSLNPKPIKGYTNLWSTSACRISVESANLTVQFGDECVSIYGDIHISSDGIGKAYSIYHRPSHRPETVRKVKDLTLSGPNHFLLHDSVEFLYVDLYEEGGEAFLQQRVFVENFFFRFNESTSVSATGEKGTLTVTITPLSPSIPANLRLTLRRPPKENGWAAAVSGSVRVIHNLPSGEIRELMLLKSESESSTKEVAIGKRVILDREFFLVPVSIDDKYVEFVESKMRDKSHITPEKRNNMFGKGSSFVIDINLRLSLTEEDDKRSTTSYRFAGPTKIEPLGSQSLGVPYVTTLKPTTTDQSGCGSDLPELELLVWTFSDFLCLMEEEPFETSLRLYDEVTIYD